MADTINSVILSWASSRAYSVNDVVNNGGSYYRCNTAHTSGATFAADSAKWTTLSPSPTGSVYSSLPSWDAARARNVASGDREIVECYAGIDLQTAIYNVSSSWAGSGEVIIRKATTSDFHAGSQDAGYRFSNSNTYQSIGSVSYWPNPTLDGIVVKNTNTGTDNGSECIHQASNPNFKMLNCILTRVKASAVYSAFKNVQSNAFSTLINCVIIASGKVIEVGENFPPGARCYNCVFISTDGGVCVTFGYATALTLKNCYMHTSGTVLDDVGWGTRSVTTCHHSTSQSITGSTGNTTYDTSNFTNVTSGSEDLSLPSGSALIDVGTDLSADADYPFNTDILGATRSGTWDVGAFEYAGPAFDWRDVILRNVPANFDIYFADAVAAARRIFLIT